MISRWPGPELRLPRGDHLTLKVRVYDGRAKLQAVGTPAAGAFRLRYRGRNTVPIAYNASAADIQVALDELVGLRVGRITCAGGPLPAAVTVEFTGDQSDESPLDLEVADELVTGTGPAGYDLVPARQSLAAFTKLTFTAKASLYDSAAVFALEIGSGVTVTDAAEGEADIALAPAETRATAIVSGRETVLWADLQGKDGVPNYVTLWRGRLIFEPDAGTTEP